LAFEHVTSLNFNIHTIGAGYGTTDAGGTARSQNRRTALKKESEADEKERMAFGKRMEVGVKRQPTFRKPAGTHEKCERRHVISVRYPTLNMSGYQRNRSVRDCPTRKGTKPKLYPATGVRIDTAHREGNGTFTGLELHTYSNVHWRNLGRVLPLLDVLHVYDAFMVLSHHIQRIREEAISL
jgi:hypothetical protein